MTNNVYYKGLPRNCYISQQSGRRFVNSTVVEKIYEKYALFEPSNHSDSKNIDQAL